MLATLTTTTLGKVLTTFLISMAPVIELRGGLPYRIALGLDYAVALARRPGQYCPRTFHHSLHTSHLRLAAEAEHLVE